MNIMDIVSLAKAGYKPSDVKELIELSKNVEPGVNAANINESHNTPEDKTDENIENKPGSTSNTGIASDGAEDELDKLRKEISELKSQLKDAQSVNINQNAGNGENKKTLDEQLLDMFK